jgi:hypothetical protein
MPRLSRDRTVAVGQVRGSLTCAGDPYFSSTSRIRSIPQCGLSCFRRAHCIYPDFGRHGAPSWLEQTSDALILRARARMASMPYQDGSENSVALRPDVIFAPGLSIVVARTQTQTVPIVFTQTTAPVERGFVASLARPAHCLTKNVTEQVPADDWGGVTESGRCRRWREGSAWARGERWCRW